MPARRKQQSNAMLYTLIIFVGLFIVSTTIAVIYYVKAEEYRAARDNLQNEIDNYATNNERQDVGRNIGSRTSGMTWLGTMTDHLDNMVTLIVGGVAESTSAEVKANQANSETETAIELAQEHIDIQDPNMMGLVPVIERLTTELESTKNLQLETQKQLENLQKEFENSNKANIEKEQALLAEKEKLMQDVEQAKLDYKNLQDLLRQSTQEQVKNLATQLQELTVVKETLEDKLNLKEAELAEARQVMRQAKAEVAKIVPGPDQEATAYKPDGKIISVDNKAKVVHLNIGSNEHVYRGLTFTVYDRGTSIEENIEGKAEIKVFDIAETHSAAQIIDSELSKPILLDDIVANLIWDSSKTNVFVVTGDFDLEGDGTIDYNAIDRITAIIEKWGGRIDKNISIDTDFLLLGQPPHVPDRPTLEEQQLDPTAMQKYEAALERLNRYTNMQERAQALWIPIFTYDKFLYLIGYQTQASQAGAF
jgi:hypothetical protein